MIHPVILCGGSGTRLWPLSRKSYPKQFARLLNDRSLFQASAIRLSGALFAPPVIVTGSDFRFIVTEQLAAAEIAPAAVLIEPEGRNTAPAILAAALLLHQRDPGALMLVAPSDHVIPDSLRFHAAVRAGMPAAQAGQLVTFGILPDRPETGYGWLELSQPPAPDLPPEPQPLRRFVEKPDPQAAAELLDSGRHLWNAGIFLFSTDAILQAFDRHAPGMVAPVRAAVSGARSDLGFTRLDPAAWSQVPEGSIDYSVMEAAENLTVVPFAGAWSDLGDWNAVWRDSPQDASAVATSGPATAIDCQSSLLRSEVEGQQIVGIGLTDIVAIAMPDAVLVAHRDRAQDVKQAVALLKAAGAGQAEIFPRHHRPWGWFESIALGQRFQVKRIVVHPGGALSLQSHHHRAEHWIVVEGTARVTIDGAEQLVTENQSVFIPLGVVHRLENPGKLPMVLIEVQTGGYLGDDDIIRYDDAYARAQDDTG